MTHRASRAVLAAVLTAALPMAVCAEFFVEGEKPPAFQARDLSGRSQSISRYAGDVVVLHFWATWCPYCRGEVPKLKRVHEELGKRGARIVTVSVDETLQKLQQYVKREQLPYAVIADGTRGFEIAGAYGVQGIPVTIIIGRDGRIAGTLMGPGDIFSAVEYVLAQPASTPQRTSRRSP